MQDLITQASFMAHGYCLLWQPWLVSLFAGSDLLIFLAYAAIPVALLKFLRMRPDIKERRLVVLFASFILLCGITHLISIATLWIPIYPVLAVAKAATGIVSAITAVVLFRLIPRLATLPHPQEMQKANDRLTREIEAHESTLAALREAQSDLEKKIASRTEALDRSNAQMRVLMREMAHRSRNLLTVVQSIARQGARHADDLRDFTNNFFARLQVLADATNQMAEGWDNRASALREVLERQIAPYAQSYPGRIALEGEEVTLQVEAAGQIALAVHELATNASKYGAFAQDDGDVTIRWEETAEGGLLLEWRERTGRPAVVDTPDPGFGAVLLKRAVPLSLSAELAYAPEPDGLSYRLDIPAKAVRPRAPVVAQPPTPDELDGAVPA